MSYKISVHIGVFQEQDNAERAECKENDTLRSMRHSIVHLSAAALAATRARPLRMRELSCSLAGVRKDILPTSFGSSQKFTESRTQPRSIHSSLHHMCTS